MAQALAETRREIQGLPYVRAQTYGGKEIMDEITAIIISAAFIIFILIGAVSFNSYECHTKAKMQGYECSWGIVQGCMVKVDEKWVDYDKWRIFE